jgi:hypothetical protein
MRIIQETQQFNPIEVKVLVETQEEYNNLLEYVKSYETKAVSSGREPDSDGWISNEGNNTRTWPEGYGIVCNTKIEVKKRNGKTDATFADSWYECWKETDRDPDDIIKFRIVKD